MTGDQIGNLSYLVLLGTVLIGWLLVANRGNWGKLARYAATWVFIFLGGVVAIGLWMDIRTDVIPRQSVIMDGARIEVPRSADGHFYLMLDVNGTPTRFVVDTGATEIVLRQEDAERAGIAMNDLVYSGRAFTANGVVNTAPVVLDAVALGGVVDHRVRAIVNRGDMAESLLGMRYLQRFDRLEIADGRLVLER